jgi:hypothetical protein
MRRFTQSIAAVLTLAGMGLMSAAHAQYGPSDPPANNGEQAKASTPRNNIVQFYPFTEFRGHASNNGVASSSVVDGSIVAVESGWVAGGKQSYAFGAWSFFRGDAAIIEGHGKFYFNDRFGIQAGLIGATRNQAGLDSDYFGLVNLSPRRHGRATGLSLQLGLGVYAYARNSAQFSGFLQASVRLKANLYADASYWYVGTPSGNLDRFALGASYKF